MKIKLIQTGKTEEKYLQEGIRKYEERVKHYIPFQMLTLPALRKARHLTDVQQTEKEAAQLLDNLQGNEHVVLLDERGKQFTSAGFAGYLNTSMHRGIRQLVFVIGGPYGFSPAVYRRAQELISLSKMTFSHQMIRLFFTEQLYRAFTILRNEPYHHK